MTGDVVLAGGVIVDWMGEGEFHAATMACAIGASYSMCCLRYGPKAWLLVVTHVTLTSCYAKASGPNEAYHVY